MKEIKINTVNTSKYSEDEMGMYKCIDDMIFVKDEDGYKWYNIPLRYHIEVDRFGNKIAEEEYVKFIKFLTDKKRKYTSIVLLAVLGNHSYELNKYHQADYINHIHILIIGELDIIYEYIQAIKSEGGLLEYPQVDYVQIGSAQIACDCLNHVGDEYHFFNPELMK